MPYKYKIKIEKRLDSPRWLNLAIPCCAIALAFLFGAVFLWLQDISPVRAYMEMLKGSFGDSYGLGESVVKAIPLTIAGLAVSLSFTMLVWNIGAEGQIYLGAVATAAAVRYLFVDNSLVMFVIMFVSASIAAGAWAAFAGWLRARFDVNEIITTLMMNYIAMLLLDYFVYGPWKDPTGFGFPMTARFPDAARLAVISGTRLHLGFLIAIVFVFIYYYVMRKTKWGYEVRVIGESPRAAKYAGMDFMKNALLVMFISGALAGIAGMAQVSGLQGRLQHGFSAGYGYTAIIVAWLARLNPFGVVLVAFLMGALLVGGDTLQIVMRLPLSGTQVIQGLILFFVLGGEFFREYRITLKESGDE